MTTNNLERLRQPEYRATSDALFRPGRVDLIATFAHPDGKQLRDYFEAFFKVRATAAAFHVLCPLPERQARCTYNHHQP